MGFDPISLMTIGKFIGVASSVVGAVSGIQASNAQAAVAERNSIVMAENARKLAEQNQQNNMDLADQQAAEKGQALAEMGASGLDAATGSSALQSAALARLARRDQNRTAVEGTNNVEQAKQGAADFHNQALQTKQAGRMQLFGNIAGGFDSYISSSTAIAKAKLDLLK